MLHYDFTLLYHHGKANALADSLSRRWEVSTAMLKLTKEIAQWKPYEDEGRIWLAHHDLRQPLVSQVLEAQKTSEEWPKMLRQVTEGDSGFTIDSEDGLRSLRMLWVPSGDVRKRILNEVLNSSLAIHPGCTKMYHD